MTAPVYSHTITYSAEWPPEPEMELEPDLWDRISGFASDVLYVALSPLRSYVTHQIFSKTYKSPEEKALIDQHREGLIKNHQGERITLETPDHVKLDGMIFRGKKASSKVFLVPNPKGMCYEVFAEQIVLWIRHSSDDVTILFINHSGIAESEGEPTPEGLSIDAYTGYKYLIIHENIDPDDILLYAISLAGCYGTIAAAMIQNEFKEKKIKAVLDRTFGYFPTAVEQYIGGIVGKIYALFMRLTGWGLNTIEALRQLKGNVLVIYHKLDSKVQYPASLYLSLLVEDANHFPPLTTIELTDDGKNLEDEFHGRLYYHSESERIISACRELLRVI